MSRPEGTLVTNHGGKATAFARAPKLHDALMAHLMDYPEAKLPAMMQSPSRMPQVVQGMTPRGDVVHETLASPQGMNAAVQQAAAVAPNVRVTTPARAIGRRVAGLLGL